MFSWLFHLYHKDTQEDIDARRDRNNAEFKRKQLLNFCRIKSEIENKFEASAITPCPKCDKKPILEIKTSPEDFCWSGYLHFDIICRPHYGIHLLLSYWSYKEEPEEIDRLFNGWNYKANNIIKDKIE